MKMRAKQERIARGLYWDRAWYLVHGCRPRSAGCAHCWSAAAANMRQHNPNPKICAQYAGIIDPNTDHFNGWVHTNEQLLDLPLRVERPKIWAIWDDLFYGDAADLEWTNERRLPFKAVPDNFIYAALETMLQANWHRYIMLTKRAHRMCRVVDHFCESKGLVELPAHIIGMVTIEQGRMAGRLEWLSQSRFSLRGVSAEPLLDSAVVYELEYYAPWLDWITAGAESGPGRRIVALQVFRDLRNFCVLNYIPLFVKQMDGDNGVLLKLPRLDGQVWDQFPKSW